MELPMIANLLHPDLMTAEERLAELADLLATGVIRLSDWKSREISTCRREFSLDCPPDQSGDGQPLKPKVRRD
jgi:hypothetical protein